MFGLMASLIRPYGFFGIEGLFGLIVGLIILIVICVFLWKIMEVVLAKLGLDAGWQQAIKLLLTLLIFLAFCHFFGFY